MYAAITLPNLLSCLRIILTPLFVALLWRGGESVLWAAIIFTLAAFTDFCDGYLARKFHMKSVVGVFLDPLADKVLVLATFAAFSWVGLLDWWIVVLLVVRDVVVTSLRVACLHHGQSMHTSDLAKWKTTIQFLSIYLMLFFLVAKSWRHISWCHTMVEYMRALSLIPIVMYSMALLTLLSGVIYVVHNRRIIKQLFINFRDVKRS
jgi:CDP-diacylglycerol--glycerol-3-phosphate 3-phosphatidyltransferase